MDIIRPTVWAPPPPSNQPLACASTQWKFIPDLSGLLYSHRRCQLCGILALTGYRLCQDIRPSMHKQGL